MRRARSAFSVTLLRVRNASVTGEQGEANCLTVHPLLHARQSSRSLESSPRKSAGVDCALQGVLTAVRE